MTVGPRSWLTELQGLQGLQDLEPVFDTVEQMRQQAIGAVPQVTLPSVRSSIPQLSTLLGPSQQQQPAEMPALPQATAPEPRGFLSSIPGLDTLMGLGSAPEEPAASSRGVSSVAASDGVPGETAASPVAPAQAPTRPQAGAQPSTAPSGTPAAMPTGAPAQGTGDLEAWARSEARRLGIDENMAVRVGNTEGGFNDPVRQNARGAPAYGPYQAYIGGPQNPGLGDEMLAHGIDPRKPEDAKRAITYSLEHAAKNGWRAFQGAAAAGIGTWDGIGQRPQAPQPQPAAMPEQASAATPRVVPLQTPNMGGPRQSTQGIVIHSTRGQGATPDAEFQGTLNWFRNPKSEVSASAVIAADGTVALVGDPDRQTWHAGENNANRLGIELVQSAKDAEAGKPFTDAQYRSLAWLTQQWSRRYGFPLNRSTLTGHEELEQGHRAHKTDPGPTFDWGRYLHMVGGSASPTAGAPQPAGAPVGGDSSPPASSDRGALPADSTTLASRYGEGQDMFRASLEQPLEEGGTGPERDPRRFTPVPNIEPLGPALRGVDVSPSYMRPGTRNRAVPGMVDEWTEPASAGEGLYPSGWPRNSAVAGDDDLRERPPAQPGSYWESRTMNPGPGYEGRSLPGTRNPDEYPWTGNIPDLIAPNTSGGANQQLSYRAPLGLPTDPEASTGAEYDPRDADQGPREMGYATTAATYGDAGDEPQVPAYQPSTSNDVDPPQFGPPLSEAGPEQPSAMQQATDWIGGKLKPIYDTVGNVVGYVQANQEQNRQNVEQANAGQDGGVDFGTGAANLAGDIGTTVTNEGIVNPITRAVANPIRQATGRAPLTAEEEAARQYPTARAIDEAVKETARGIGKDVSELQSGTGTGMALGALGLLGDLAPSTTIARQLNELGPRFDISAYDVNSGEFSPLIEHVGLGDVVMGAQLVNDARRLGYGAIKVGGRTWDRIAQAVREGVPAERFGQWLSQNAERVAAADARMAAEGSTVAPGVFGMLPEGRGQGPFRTHREALETADARVRDLSTAYDDALNALTRAEETGTDAEYRAADRAWREIAQEFHAAVTRRTEIADKLRAFEAEREGMGFGRSYEAADLISSPHASEREATSPYRGKPAGEIPRTRDDTSRSVSLNAGFGVVPDEAPRARPTPEPWRMTPDEWQAEQDRLQALVDALPPHDQRTPEQAETFRRWYMHNGDKPAALTPTMQAGPFEADSRLRPAIESSYLRPDDYRFVGEIRVSPRAALQEESTFRARAGLATRGAPRAKVEGPRVTFQHEILGDENAGRTMTHEIGHTIENNLPESLAARWEREIHPPGNDFEYGRFLQEGGERPPTAYGHETPREDFAETFAEWRQAQAEGRAPNLGPLRQQFMQDVDAWLSGGVRGAPEGQQLQLLSTAGTAPGAQQDVWRRPDPLAAVNRALGQVAASTFSGGTAAAAADQLGDPNDPNRQAKAFVAGALAPPLLARGGRALARRAGAEGEGVRGLLAAFGQAPGAGGFNPQNVQRAVQQAQQQAQPGLSPLEWTRRFAGEVGYSSMIGPATFTVNVLGNLMEPLYAIPKEAVRAGVRGNPREFTTMAGKALSYLSPFHGLGEVGTAMVDALMSRGRFAATPGHAPLSAQTNNPIGKAITTGLEAGGRVFSALPDAVFGTIARGAGEARAAAQSATDAGLTGAAWKQHVNDLLTDAKAVKNGAAPTLADTDHVIEQGEKYAKRQTFQDELGAIGKNVRDFATVAVVPDGQGGRKPLPVIGNLITPFFNTPWNMNTRMLERTPAGYLMNSQGSKFDRYYDATLGSALLIGLAAGPVASGAITGGGPADPQKKSEMRSQGWRPYSTLIDGVYVPNRVFGIYAPLLNAAADVHDSIVYAKDKTPGSITSDYVGRLGQQLQQQPYLQGISNIMQAFQAGQGGGLGSAAERFASSNITRMVPYAATGRAIGTAVDPNERTVDSGKNVPAETTIRQQVQSGVGVRSGLPVAQDVLGRPQENQQQGLKAMFARTSSERADPVIKAFLDANVDIGFPRDTISISGMKLELSPEEKRRWNEARGDMLVRFVAPLAQNGALSRMPQAVREKTLKDYLDMAAQQADTRVFAEIPPAERSRRMREAVQAMQKAS